MLKKRKLQIVPTDQHPSPVSLDVTNPKLFSTWLRSSSLHAEAGIYQLFSLGFLLSPYHVLRNHLRSISIILLRQASLR